MSDFPGVYKPLSEADTETRHVLNRPTPARFDREYPYVAPPGSEHTHHELDYLISLIPLREKWGLSSRKPTRTWRGCSSSSVVTSAFRATRRISVAAPERPRSPSPS